MKYFIGLFTPLFIWGALTTAAVLNFLFADKPILSAVATMLMVCLFILLICVTIAVHLENRIRRAGDR